MRYLLYVIWLGGSLFGQAMLENAAAAAGGSVGGVAGKKLSDGLSGVFGKVDNQTAKAAKDAGKSKPLFEVGPGVPKGKAESVPPPPPPPQAHAAAVVHKFVPAPAPEPRDLPFPAILPPPPLPPEVSREDLKRIPVGMGRTDLLNLGAPAARITMFEGGHLVEVYRYAVKDTAIGVVELSDGAVSSVR